MSSAILPEASSSLVFYVNGTRVQEEDVNPEWTLLWYLRNKLRLVGTKLACGEGGCGACTVMISKMTDGSLRHLAVNACLYPLASTHGCAVTTVEGLGNCRTKLHPLQERLAKSHGSQCGFCTPGFIMSAYALLRSKPTPPTMEELEDALVGNLCRCTGYRPILEAFKTFTEEAKNGCGRSDCCKLKRAAEESEDVAMVTTDVLYDPAAFSPYDPTQELIFPPELKLTPNLPHECLKFSGPRVTFYQVNQLKQLLALKNKFPTAKLVVGNTELGVEVRFKNQLYPVLVNVSNVAELQVLDTGDDGLLVGAAVCLTTLKQRLEAEVARLPVGQTRVFSALAEMLRWFAGRQIRNVACIGGNILTSSPISDINPILLAAGATLYFSSETGGDRSVVMDRSFFTGYRRCAVEASEVLVAVKIPFTRQGEFFESFKQARRRDDDIAIVNSAMRVKVDFETSRVQEASLAFGGVAATTVSAEKTAKVLIGMNWSESGLVERIAASLIEELEVPPSAPGGMVPFRNTLMPSFFFKFYLRVKKELSQRLSASEEELVRPYSRQHMKATHLYQRVSPSQPLIDPVGRPVAHSTSIEQCTGEAVYVDDMPKYSNELHAALVLSTKAKAKILSVDAEEALALPGVRAFISEKDLPGKRNSSLYILSSEDIFARGEVICVGQPIGAIVADNGKLAERAAKLVKVQYSEVEKPIVTIEEAIEAKSYRSPKVVFIGDVEKGHAEADHTIEGEVRIGGQEHFYMETNAHIAVPLENGCMEVFSNTQCPSGTQFQIASALGVPGSKVVVRVKRLGGGFGGKESRTPMASIPAAIAASIMRRPVRIVLDRHTDMLMTGGRHPYLAKWKVSFDKSGLLKAVESELFSNSGCTQDLSESVIDRTLFTSDNGYKCDNRRITARSCITNLPSNTAFRGFGAPQASFIMDSIMSQVATYLDKDPAEVRELNLYREGDKTVIRKTLENYSLRDCWSQVKQQAQYASRRAQVDLYNSSHTHTKKGLAITPVQFGVSFTASFLNQGGALVMIYKDGSVLVTHGGVEMGQGLNVKTLQVASRVLQIPLDKIHLTENATDKVPNCSPTAASMGSDLYGEAVLRACTALNERLEPVKKANPNDSWEGVVLKAYLQRLQLSAVGHYNVPGIETFNFDTQEGNPYNYYSVGAAVSEVQLDCLTGDHTILRTDIVMDVGDSLNPAIDIGQIEGGFMQGVGLHTLEELRYSPDGVLLTRGPGMYKMPGVQDIPCEFNVTLLRDSPNPKAVYSSRAVGEPPLILASSVFFALRDAIASARNSSSQKYFRLDSPLTAERIRMACEDSFTKKVPVHEPGSFRPWDVTV